VAEYILYGINEANYPGYVLSTAGNHIRVSAETGLHYFRFISIAEIFSPGTSKTAIGKSTSLE